MEICQVCGEVVQILTNNHCMKHNISRSQYRAKYGSHPVFIPVQKRMSEADVYESIRKTTYAK